MARLALLFSLVLSVLALAATTAGAATHIGAGLESDWPPVFQPYMRGIGVLADNGVNHDIVINPSHAQQAGGFPQAVDVYDYGDTVVVDHGPCRVYSAHHAACIVSGPPHDPNDSYSYDSFSSISVDTGDGNDKVTISDPLNPMIASAWTGAGDDRLDISGMWQIIDVYSGGSDGLGPGNDAAKIGPASPFSAPLPFHGTIPIIDGRDVSGGTGDDTITSLNGTIDHIHCDEGNDTWVADPVDDQKQIVYSGPPDTNGDCESRTPPAALAP